MYAIHDLLTSFLFGIVFGILITSCFLMYVNHVLPKKLKRYRMKNKRRQAYDLPHLRRVK